MIRLRANLHCLRETGGASGEDHELLESKLVTGMGTAVDDVECGARQNIGGFDTSKLGKVLVYRHTLLRSASLYSSDGNTEDSVSTELALVWSTVEFDKEVVDLFLLCNLEARLDKLRAEDGVDILNSLEDT